MLYHLYAEDLSETMYKLSILAVISVVVLVWAELRSRKLKQVGKSESGAERNDASGE